MKRLYIGARGSSFPVNGRQLRAQQVLRRVIVSQCGPNVFNPVAASKMGLIAKAYNFNIVGKTVGIALSVAFVNGCRVGGEQVLQC
jgi:hypothetical protein